MKKVFVLLIMLLFHTGYSQSTTNSRCYTPDMDTTEFNNLPYVGNNDFLENFLDSIGYPNAGTGNRIVGSPTVKFWIPIQFWVYRNNDGTGGPNLRQIQTLMDNLNRRYNQANNTWIGFYMKCTPIFINNSTHVVKTFAGASLLMATNNDIGSINVHIIGSFMQSDISGFALAPLNACMVPSSSYLSGRNNGDLSHEVGHVLGLQHTHQYSALDLRCYTECVSRTRTWPIFNLCTARFTSNRVCEATGDALRDTQADNDLIGNSSCFYSVNFGNDVWGDSYDNPPAGAQDRPNVRNIMSYNTATDCVDQFSRLQIAVMLRALVIVKANNLLPWTNPVSTFDSFEPDDAAEVARSIEIGQIQERNFHQQFFKLSLSGPPLHTQCDVDWVRFVSPCTSTLVVSTSAIPNRTNANTRLTLFNSNLGQLAQNDNINGANQFSRISFNFVAGQEYFIRVENMGNLVTGYYNLQVAPLGNSTGITGATTVCTSSAYSVNNLPQGAIVNWSVTPANIVALSCINCNQTTATVIGNGTATLTANVNSCIAYTRSITAGAPSPPSISPSNYDVQCGTFAEAYATIPPGTIGHVWNLNFGMVVQDMNGYGSNYFYTAPLVNTPQTGLVYYNYLSVQAKNACGLSDPSPTISMTVGPVPTNCGGGGGPILRVVMSPVPTGNQLNIAVNTQEMQQSGTNNPAWMQIREVTIYDKFGVMRKRKQFGVGSQQVNILVQDLPNDVYNVHVTNGIHTTIKQILIQR